MKRILIIASHEKMADGMKDTLNFISGGIQETIALSAYVDNRPVEEAVDEVMDGFEGEDEVVVLTDLMVGSVNQKFFKYRTRPHTHIVSGMNLPLAFQIAMEPQGKYMAFAQKASASATSYTTMLCFSRANSIYDEYGVNLGCNLIGNWYTLKNFKIGSISAGGYTAFSGAIPIVCEITNNGNSWTYSHLRVYNGIIVGYWN